jgi:hypothetical protein
MLREGVLAVEELIAWSAETMFSMSLMFLKLRGISEALTTILAGCLKMPLCNLVILPGFRMTEFSSTSCTSDIGNSTGDIVNNNTMVLKSMGSGESSMAIHAVEFFGGRHFS